VSLAAAVLVVSGLVGMVVLAIRQDKKEADPVSQFIEEEKGSIAGQKRKSKDVPPGVRARIEATVKKLDRRDHSRKGSAK